MSLVRLHNLFGAVYRPVQTVSATSGGVVVTWNAIGTIRCTIQGLSSKQAMAAGANRTENTYTLYTVPGMGIRPRDRVEITNYPTGENIEGTAGTSSPTPITYIVESGPIDQSGRNKVLEYTVLRTSSTSDNS